ncbi:major tail protein [Arthrobacter phage Sarge]|uniref:Major tail protein n=1 Tax=Arthrobacter phage Sarge TaxID=2885974 RepID=A0AAE9C1Y9_9CAUD|nr:major tail protein [Arthrobacter phage Sarge]UDL14859.1 major tail protein [Arthrobacter phage Sarge]
MATFTEAKGHTPSNIRKILEMAIFVKPVEDDDTAITQVYVTATGLTIPTGYLPVGMVTKDDGATWTRDQESSDVTSYGYAEPVRRDIVSDVTGLSFTMQESKKTTMELFHGLDLSTVTTDSAGNFFFDKASRPAQRKYRVLALGKDGDGPDAVYVARWLPNAQITENGEQAWSEGDEVKYPATFTAYTDSTFGTSFREIWGGPGLDHAAMGFPAPSA